MTPEDKIKMYQEEIKFVSRHTAVIAQWHQQSKDTLKHLQEKLKEEKEKLK
jgi:DNA integrity scanning protein DisA with diadenylate cyclase activity